MYQIRRHVERKPSDPTPLFLLILPLVRRRCSFSSSGNHVPDLAKAKIAWEAHFRRSVSRIVHVYPEYGKLHFLFVIARYRVERTGLYSAKQEQGRGAIKKGWNDKERRMYAMYNNTYKEKKMEGKRNETMGCKVKRFFKFSPFYSFCVSCVRSFVRFTSRLINLVVRSWFSWTKLFSKLIECTRAFDEFKLKTKVSDQMKTCEKLFRCYRCTSHASKFCQISNGTGNKETTNAHAIRSFNDSFYIWKKKKRKNHINGATKLCDFVFPFNIFSRLQYLRIITGKCIYFKKKARRVSMYAWKNKSYNQSVKYKKNPQDCCRKEKKKFTI